MMRLFARLGREEDGHHPALQLGSLIQVGCVGALLIIVAAIATPIAKTQKMREAWFYVMSSGVVLKIVTMEIARIIL